MKKLFTLFLALGTVAAVHAQSSKEEARGAVLGRQGQKEQKKTERKGSEESRDVVLGRENRGGFPAGSRQAEIDQVNREYDAKIESIRSNPTLSQEEKQRAIRELERERQRRIAEINRKQGEESREFSKDKKQKKAKSNNGKRLGWEKGVGNPHREGADWKKKKRS